MKAKVDFSLKQYQLKFCCTCVKFNFKPCL